VVPKTSNLYGKIIISKSAIKQVVLATAVECYGVAQVGRARVACEDNRIEATVAVFLKFGVTIDPVIDSIRRAIKYNVENFTGMTVDSVNIDVLGIKN